MAGHARRFLKRPDAPRRIALVLLVVFVVAWPWFVFGLVALVSLAAAITWFTLGPDRASELVVAWHGWLSQRDPAMAETIRRRAARVSRAIMALADRLPDRWAEGVYLPDFEPTDALAEKMKDDPFARLAAQAQADEGTRAPS